MMQSSRPARQAGGPRHSPWLVAVAGGPQMNAWCMGQSQSGCRGQGTFLRRVLSEDPASVPADPHLGRAGRMAEVTTENLDLELVRRVQRGDSAAFDLLVRKHQHRVVAVIGRYIHDWSECQDVAQDTFLRAYRAIGNFRGDAQFSTWLHRIAVNTAKNHLVAHKRRPPGDDIDIDDAEQFESALRMRDNDTPERELMRQQMEQTVMRAVEALPEELRVAITLREVEGLSYEEIAQQMQCPIGTVRSRIFRARDAIDTQLRPLLDAPNPRERATR